MNGLTGRKRGLAQIGATALPNCSGDVGTLAARLDEPLKRMGALWK